MTWSIRDSLLLVAVLLLGALIGWVTVGRRKRPSAPQDGSDPTPRHAATPVAATSETDMPAGDGRPTAPGEQHIADPGPAPVADQTPATEPIPDAAPTASNATAQPARAEATTGPLSSEPSVLNGTRTAATAGHTATEHGTDISADDTEPAQPVPAAQTTAPAHPDAPAAASSTSPARTETAQPVSPAHAPKHLSPDVQPTPGADPTQHASRRPTPDATSAGHDEPGERAVTTPGAAAPVTASPVTAPAAATPTVPAASTTPPVAPAQATSPVTPAQASPAHDSANSGDSDQDDTAQPIEPLPGRQTDSRSAADAIATPPQSNTPIAGDPVHVDDFRRLAGVGPKVANALQAAGIHTFAQLADADEATLREAIRQAGVRSAPTLPTWPQQARALATTR